MYQINQTHGLLKKINSVIQKITEPIQPKVAEHKPQTVKRLSYPFSREKQHLWVKAFPEYPQVPASLTAAQAPESEWEREHQHFGGLCSKEYLHFAVNLLLGGFFWLAVEEWVSAEKSLWVLAAAVAHNVHLCNCTLHLLGCQKRIYNVIYNSLFSTLNKMLSKTCSQRCGLINFRISYIWCGQLTQVVPTRPCLWSAVDSETALPSIPDQQEQL